LVATTKICVIRFAYNVAELL